MRRAPQVAIGGTYKCPFCQLVTAAHGPHGSSLLVRGSARARQQSSWAVGPLLVLHCAVPCCRRCVVIAGARFSVRGGGHRGPLLALRCVEEGHKQCGVLGVVLRRLDGAVGITGARYDVPVLRRPAPRSVRRNDRRAERSSKTGSLAVDVAVPKDADGLATQLADEDWPRAHA